MMTLDQQTEIAIAVHGKIGNEIYIAGDKFSVNRWANEIRFSERPRNVGQVALSAHVTVIRADLAKSQILPVAFQSQELGAKCASIVMAALATIGQDGA